MRREKKEEIKAIMKRKLWTGLLALVLLSLCVAGALAEADIKLARFPQQRGSVTDDTNVLTEAMRKDIAEFAGLSTSQAGVQIQVVLVHFLDGLSPQEYAKKLFERWNLSGQDFLLLGAVGEDSFASVSGGDVKQGFSDSNAQSLLYTSKFSELFKQQRYDEAFARYFLAFADMMEKQMDAKISLGNLFAAYHKQEISATADDRALNAAVSGAVSKGSQMWSDAIESIGSSVRDYDNYHERKERDGNGLTPAGWIVLVILLMIIFGQKDPSRRGKRRGCSPLGWILGAFGLGSLLKRWRR